MGGTATAILFVKGNYHESSKLGAAGSGGRDGIKADGKWTAIRTVGSLVVESVGEDRQGGRQCGQLFAVRPPGPVSMRMKHRSRRWNICKPEPEEAWQKPILRCQRRSGSPVRSSKI